MQLYHSKKYTVDKICELVGGIRRKTFYNIKNEVEANAGKFDKLKIVSKTRHNKKTPLKRIHPMNFIMF